MKKLVLSIALVLIILVVSAKEKDYKYGLGFSGGMISGSGFSFRKLSDIGGYQINFGAIMQNADECEDCFGTTYEKNYFLETDDTFTEQSTDMNMNINLGYNLYKTLHIGTKSKLYLLAGGAVYMSSDKVYEQDYNYNNTSNYWEKSGNQRETFENDFLFNIGGGFGFDYKISQNIVLNLEWPLTVSLSDDGTNIFMYIPQAGIHYYFK